MPEKEIVTDEQLEAVKVQMDSGKLFRDAVKGAGIEVAPGAVRRQMAKKFGSEAFRASMMAGRPVPTFKNLENLIDKLAPRLTDATQINKMIANLAAVVYKLDQIKDKLSQQKKGK